MRGLPEPRRPAPLEPGTGYPSVGYPELATADPLHVRDYLRVLYRHRWVIAVIMLLGISASVFYNWRAIRIYESWSTLQIEADPNVLGLERPLVDQRDWMREFLPTQLGILQSRDLASMAREQLKLAASVERAGSDTPDAATMPDDDGERGLPSVDEIVDGRTVAAIVNTRLVNIGFRSSDPELAARVANALAEAYVRWNFEFKTSTTGAASDWLADQVEEQRKVVQASEAALQRYREQHGADALRTLPTISNAATGDRQNIVVQKLAELQAAVTRARAETIEKETDYQQLVAIQTSQGALDTLPAIASNGYIQALKSELSGLQHELSQASARLGERHPEIIRLQGAVENADRKLQTEMAKVAASIRNQYEAARGRERALVAALDRQKLEVSDLNAKAVEYTALEGEARANRQLLDNLVQRSRQITLARDLPSANARVLDAAEVPSVPILPRQERNLTLGFAGSGMLALGLVFLLEIFNTRLTSPDDVRRHLGVQVIGVTPQVKGTNGHGGPLLSHGAPPQFAELLHGVRTSLVLAPGLAEARTLLITSSEPGEGKSMAAANLAVSLARLKQRVLLIDADLRRPKLHELFGLDQQPGLTDVLAGRATHNALRKTKVPQLWLMPAGVAARNPADLVGSERFGILVKCLREQFDWVVLDSPPVMAVTDPCLIARVASGVLFVVGSNQTPREVARAAVDQLESVGANIVGVLLNRAALDKPGESYLPYYHRDYRYYAQPEGNGWIPKVPGVPAEKEPAEEAAPATRA